MKKLFMIMLLSLSVLACAKKDADTIVREDLFALDIGRLEDELGFYNRDDGKGRGEGDLCMREGMFYIADSGGQKILRCNSYGNILSMIYNEESNPKPLTLKSKEEGKTVTRWAYTYPLLRPGKIVVDSRKHIYCEDSLPEERQGFDPESKAILESVLLHFDEEGRFVEYLGQEGVGGSPFPHLDGLFISTNGAGNDDIVVVSRSPTGWNVYWFDAEGLLLYLIKINNDSVPVPADRRDLVFASMDSITVAPGARKLFLKVDYYRETVDESTKTRAGSEIDSSVIWVMRAEDGVYEKILEAPLYEISWTEANKKTLVRIPYAVLGGLGAETIFLSFPEEKGYALCILNTDTGAQIHTSIEVDLAETQYNSFDLSPEGILSAMLVSEWDAKFVWWRTDKLLKE